MTAYAVDDGVSSNGASYIAVAANTSDLPPSANWNLVASKGDPGVAGATGATGPTGLTGPSGVVTVLQSQTFGSVAMSSSFSFVCKTAPYTAGVGETALIWALGTCLAVPAGAGLGVRPSYNINAGTDGTIGSWFYQQNAGTAVAGLTNQEHQSLALTAGSKYVFSTGLVNSNGIATWTDTCGCNTFVLVVK